ncbi:MAG: YidC/Oxa1 family membrane protein insertase [Actinomycetota bacterium]
MAEVWNGLLTGLGSALSFSYNVIPSYVVAIMLLTVGVRVLMLPLTIKQTRSMQAMQKLQPQIKELQRKHKGNRQKLNEEMMKMYKEHQVNPLGGCLPLLLQLPVFFALYRVLTTALPGNLPGTRYLPEGSRLAADIASQKAGFLGMNLACSPARAGRGMVEVVQGAEQVNCGDSWMVALPVYLLVALMVLTTYYQQRQMQRASAGPQQAQMKMMGRIMPVFLGVISVNISAGVLIYWVTTNLWQVGQQYLMLRSRPEAGSGSVPERAKPHPSGDGSPKARPSGAPSAGSGKSGGAGGKGKRSGGKGARGRKKRSKR